MANELMPFHISLPLFIQKFALFNPTKSEQRFMAIFTELTQSEKIMGLMMDSYGGEIISPKKSYHGWMLMGSR